MCRANSCLQIARIRGSHTISRDTALRQHSGCVPSSARRLSSNEHQNHYKRITDIFAIIRKSDCVHSSNHLIPMLQPSTASKLRLVKTACSTPSHHSQHSIPQMPHAPRPTLLSTSSALRTCIKATTRIHRGLELWATRILLGVGQQRQLLIKEGAFRRSSSNDRFLQIIARATMLPDAHSNSAHLFCCDPSVLIFIFCRPLERPKFTPHSPVQLRLATLRCQVRFSPVPIMSTRCAVLISISGMV